MNKITNTRTGHRLGITLSIFLLLLTSGYSSSPYPNELLIRFEPGTTQAYIDALRLEYNAVEDFSISPSPVTNIHLWYITLPTGGVDNFTEINEIVGNARGKAEVNSAGLNYTSTTLPFGQDSDAAYGVDPTILCPNQFSITCGVSNAAVRMSILDTGIGYDEDENNGHVFRSPGLFDPFYGSYLGYDFVNRDPHPQDDHGHGTHTAGIIAEIAALSKALTIRLESFKTHDSKGAGTVFNIILAVDQSIINKVDIINMSFSYQAPPPSGKVEPLEYAINEAGIQGILVVAAAGNDYDDNDSRVTPSYPASFDCENIISVASVDCHKDQSVFSNIGATRVDIATLGEDIVAPDHHGILMAKSGTSQATAITSGVAGILATNLNWINWSPLKCSILDGAEFSPSLSGLIMTEGIVHAADSYNSLMGDCGVGYRSMGQNEEGVTADLNDVTIYPNPFSDSFNFKYFTNTPEKIVVNIYNSMGQLIYKDQRARKKGIHNFNWSPEYTIPAGIYFVQILSNGKEVTKKVVKQP